MPQARYASAGDVRALLAEHGDDPDGTGGVLAEPVLDARVVTASAQVDAALATAGYRVPTATPDPDTGVTEAPQMVVDVALAVAAYLAALTARETVPMAEDHPVYLRYLWAKELLAEWAKGRQIPPGLVAPSLGDSGDLSVGEPVNGLPGPLFGYELLDPVPRGAWGRGLVYDPDYWRH